MFKIYFERYFGEKKYKNILFDMRKLEYFGI